MKRRNFLRNTGLSIGSAMIAPGAFTALSPIETPDIKSALHTWAQVRSEFLLDHHHIQMAQMLLASHPKRVRDAIAQHRKAFDESPAHYWEEKFQTAEKIVTEVASRYMHCMPGEIALTDSTTQGMAMFLNGFKLKPGDEILSTTHDHYITDKSIEFACAKKGAISKRVAEYADPAHITVDEIVSNITGAIGQKPRVVVVTWVQSCTGAKLPIKAIANAIAEINARRDTKDRIYFLVDGVHGFGNQADRAGDLGCDFFAAGTHKWIYGPRGTGVMFARKDAWDFVAPTVPPFSQNPFTEWLGQPTERETTFSELCTPGGFHTFEYRWALNEAFEFQLDIGPEKVHARTTELNSMLKEGIREMDHVKLHTPVTPALSAGINCFEVKGFSEIESVEHFHKKGIIASSSPYAVSYARLTPCIINTEDEVQQCLKVLEEMA